MFRSRTRWARATGSLGSKSTVYRHLVVTAARIGASTPSARRRRESSTLLSMSQPPGTQSVQDRRTARGSRSGQTCALGAAIFGSVAGGAYRNTEAAQRAMTGVKDVVYRPVGRNVRVYGELYAIYRDLHDAFGRTGRHPPMDEVMKRLIAIRARARKA